MTTIKKEIIVPVVPAERNPLFFYAAIIFEAIALLGVVIWVIPTTFFAFVATVLAAVSLIRREPNKKWSILTLVLSFITFLISITLLVIVGIIAWLAYTIGSAV